MGKKDIAVIAVSAAVYSIDKPYDYKIPEQLIGKVVPGSRVTVPFGRGNRRCDGVVLSLDSDSGKKGIKCIDTVMDETPVLTEEQIKLALWMRDRFFCTVFEAVRVMLPTGMWFKNGSRKVSDKTVNYATLALPGEEALIVSAQKKLKAPQQAAILELLAAIGSAAVKEICYFTGASAATVRALEKQGLLSVESVEVYRSPEISDVCDEKEIILNSEQMSVFNGISALFNSENPEAALLFGVTGSGKTSIYIELIKSVIASGKTAIVLVPEIGLTPQLLKIFSAHFSGDIAVLHSSLGMGERYDEWKRIKKGEAKVVIGTRSAVFAPVSNLGIIIVDEEQENTYKSENSPRYDAKEIAKYRCVQSKALLLMGSATPDVESMYFAKHGKYKLFTLKKRYNEMELPSVIVTDMRRELLDENPTSIGSDLRRELACNIDRGEQSILFINRRGSAKLVVCPSCGYTYTCPNCSVSMTYHGINKRLMCHYCGFSLPVKEFCPECGAKLKFSGAGTQKVEEELKEIFGDISILRMDTDTVSPARSHDRMLSEFRRGDASILLGTQMVTKGLDFENVTLVGVISADQSLYVNDYRARERTFSLITQVVGRSGRGTKSGRAVIQTFTPENEVILLASKQDYIGFYESEIPLRNALGCPPVADLLVMTVTGTDETSVLRGCVKLRESMVYYLKDMPEAKVIGPAPAGIAKINNRYRYRISVICKNSRRLRDTAAHVMREFSHDRQNRGLSVFSDINPSD